MPHRRELAAPSSLPRGPITYATNCYESYREAMTVMLLGQAEPILIAGERAVQEACRRNRCQHDKCQRMRLEVPRG